MITKARSKRLINSVEDPFLRDCLIYFTEETNKENYKLFKIPGFQDVFRQFNLDDIPISVISDKSSQIKKNPESVIPEILGFNRPINHSYFLFSIKITLPDFSSYLSKDYLDELYPHIYRCLVCSYYQLSESIIPISQGKDSERIPAIFLSSLFGFIRMLTVLSDNFIPSLSLIITKILKTFIKDIKVVLENQPNKAFIMDIMQIFSVITAIISSNILSLEENFSYLSIALDLFNNFINYMSITEELIIYLTNFADLIIHYFQNNNLMSDDFLNQIFKMITFYFQKESTDIINSKISLQLALKLFSIIVKKVDSFNDNHKDIVKAISDYLIALISKRIQYDKNYKPKKYTSRRFSDILSPKSYDFISKKTFDTALINEDNKFLNRTNIKVQTCIDADPEIVKIIVFTVHIMNDNNNFFLQFMNYTFQKLADTNDPLIQLLIEYILCYIIPKLLTLFIDNFNLYDRWNLLFNDYSFSSDVLSCIFPSSYFSLTDDNKDIQNDNNKVPSVYVDLAKKLLELVEKALDSSSSNLEFFLDAMCRRLNTESTIHVKVIISVMYTLAKKYPWPKNQNYYLYKMIIDHQYIFMLIQIDLVYKHQIISKENNDEMMKMHTLILHFFVELIKSPEICNQILNEEVYIPYFFSLLVEKDAEWISRNLLSSIIQVTNTISFFDEILVFMEYICDKGKDYITAFSNLLKSIATGIRSQNKSLIKFFLKKNMIEIISKYVSSFSETTTDHSLLFMLISSSLDLFLAFCQASNENLVQFNSFREIFVQCYLNAINKIKIDEALIDVIISLCLNEVVSFQVESRIRTLRNTSALWLLYNISNQTTLFSDRIYAYLLAIISSSVENCYHCYYCGFLLKLINDLSDSTPLIIFELINAIGSRFFGFAELTAIFQKMKQIEYTFCSHLLETVHNMFKTRIVFSNSSGFYVENESQRYFTPAFSFLKKFKLTFFCNPTNLASPQQILKISSQKESLIFSISNSNLSIVCKTDVFVQDFQYNNKNVLSEKENKIVCLYYQNFFRIILNNEYMENPHPNPKLKDQYCFEFTFTSEPITFELLDRDRIKSLCYNLTITDIQTNKKNTMIFDNSVPFPLSFCDVLPFAGGPQIFLPFLEFINKTNSPQKFLLKYIQIIGLALKDSESQVNPFFFRAFGHLLKQIHYDIWTEQAVIELKNIFFRLTNKPLKLAFINHIILDFQFWSNIDMHISKIIILKTLIQSQKENEQLFTDNIDFEIILWKFYKFANYLDSSRVESAIPKTLTSGVGLLQNYNIQNTNSIMSLLAISLSPQSSFREEALQLTFIHLYKTFDKFMELLSVYDYYVPFMEMILHEKDNPKFWAFHYLYIIYTKLKISSEYSNCLPNFEKHMISLVRFYDNFDEKPDVYIQNILGFALGEVKIFDNSLPTCSIQKSQKYQIRNPEFLILYCCISILCVKKQKYLNDVLIES